MAICCVPSVTTNQVLGILNHQLVTTKQMLLKHLTFSRTNPLVPRLDTVLPPALKPPPFCQGGKEARADVATPNTPPMAVTVNTHCVRWAQSRPLRAWTIKDFPCVVYQGLVAGRAGSLAHGFEGLTCSHPKCSRPLGI